MGRTLLGIIVIAACLAAAIWGSRWYRESERFRALEFAVGIKKSGLSNQGTMSRVLFSLVPKPVCFMGDLDVMRMELSRSDRKDLVISIESLNPRDQRFRPRAKVVKLEDLAKGLRYPIILPRATEPRALGLFICKDSSGTRECGSKEALASNRILGTYFNPRKPLAKSYRATDKIYFFQFFVQEDAEIGMLTLNGLPPRLYQTLTEYLLLKQPKGSAPVTEIVSRVASLNRTIASMPAYPRSKEIELYLPRLDRKTCRP